MLRESQNWKLHRNGHTSCIMWSTCTCGACLDLRDEHRVSLLRENFSWAYRPCGWVWLVCDICCIFKRHLLSEIKYSYCSHDAGLTDWSENQLCPQTLPVLMEPLNMDSLNKATSSEGACASLSEGSTSEPHNSGFGTQHPCREKHFQLLTLQREQPYTHQK